MPAVARTHPGTIKHMKSIKKIYSLTNIEIKEMCDNRQAEKVAMGITDYPSPSERTIQKVFALGSENELFIYELTIMPIADVLFEYSDAQKPYSEEKAEVYYEQTEGYKIIVEQKNEEIRQLKKENEYLTEVKNFLKEQLDRLTKYMLSERSTVNNP